MTSVPGVDHPEIDGEAQVTLPGRGVTVSARVEYVADDSVVVRPSVSDFVQQSVVVVGDLVEVFWKAPEDFRSLPAEVTGVDRGAVVRWRLRATGPSGVSQRRGAVRARVTLPVEVGLSSLDLSGETVDLSENGARVALDGFGMVPEKGTTMDVRVGLEDEELAVRAEAVRVQTRGARWFMSLRFLATDEKDQDRLRRRVFRALREERARLND